jgi:hypothetical protein
LDSIKTHDIVLEILGNAYQDVFLSQKNRSKGMEYFDFVMSKIHGLRIKELMDAKAEGRKVMFFLNCFPLNLNSLEQLVSKDFV